MHSPARAAHDDRHRTTRLVAHPLLHLCGKHAWRYQFTVRHSYDETEPCIYCNTILQIMHTIVYYHIIILGHNINNTLYHTNSETIFINVILIAQFETTCHTNSTAYHYHIALYRNTALYHNTS